MTHILPDTKALDEHAGLLGDVIRGEFGLTPDQRASVLHAANEAAADAMLRIYELAEETAGDRARKVQAGHPAPAGPVAGPRTMAFVETLGRAADTGWYAVAVIAGIGFSAVLAQVSTWG